MVEVSWFTAVVAVSICAILKFIFDHLTKQNLKNHKLPPGPLALPLIGNPIWYINPPSDLESTLRQLHAKYGPIMTLHFGNSPTIFISDHSLVHQTLVQNGAIFADRSPVPSTAKLITSNQRNISTAFYGSTWRVLRRNLTAEVLHPSRVKSYTPERKWVLDILINRLILNAKPKSSNEEDQDPRPVRIIDHFRYAMFCLAIQMCFGERLDGKKVNEISDSQRGVLLNFEKFGILDLFPVSVGKIIFGKLWKEIYQLRKTQEDVLLPYINARKKIKSESKAKAAEAEDNSKATPYVDTLFDLEMTDYENRRRKIDEDELVTLCSEFLDAITDTTATSLQWIMANLVKYPNIQEKVYREIEGVMGGFDEKRAIEEEDLQKMGYLKAVVLEGLRRHPPGHFLLPHIASEDVVLEGVGKGYTIPKNVSVNFMVADIGWDSKVWNDPMEFRPERFLTNSKDVEVEVDITGSREIKMMPFGAGRRICPGYALGLLHLEYFVANLIWNFKWTAVDDVDLTEIRQSSIVMKYPLQSYISPRHHHHA